MALPNGPRTLTLGTEKFQAVLTPELRVVSRLFQDHNHQLMIAGGAVRDLLMEIRPADVDFATTATPSQMKDMFSSAGIRMLNTNGEAHGTITCRVADKANFEITTLRIDVVCDGRRADIEFTTDWKEDANRRDLTINSLFLDLDGTVIDYFGGIDDVLNRKVAFVGDAERRIQEDYLRIFRYFRFFGRIAHDDAQHDDGTLDAIRRNRDGIKSLTGERIWTEQRRILVGRQAPSVLRVMYDVGIAPYLSLPPDVDLLEHYTQVFNRFSSSVEPATMLSILCRNTDDLTAFHARCKLSNKERWLTEFIIQHRDKAREMVSDQKWWRHLVADNSVWPASDKDRAPLGMAHCRQLARSVLADDETIRYLDELELPVFPLNGANLLHAGVDKGPRMKATLMYLFDIWKQSEFLATQEELLTRAFDAEATASIPQKQKSQKRKRQESAGSS